MAEYVINKYRALFVRAKDLYHEEKYKEAVTLLELIIRNDETCYEGMYYLGSIYYYGLSGKKDYERAYELLTMAAMNKYIEASYLVGLCCLNGYGCEVNYTQAKSWFEMAAKNGHVGAQYYLGLAYYNGFGTNRSLQTALRCFLIAAKSKHTLAKFMAAKCYEEMGKYVSAATMYLASAIDGNPEGCEIIADYYLEGKYIDRRPDLAIYFYEKGYQNKNYNCAYKLGLIYKKGEDASLDYKKAFSYFEDAASNKIIDAKYEMALALYDGNGVDRDSRLAVKLLKSDDLAKHKKALRTLGNIYEFPNSPLIDEDPVEAKNYWMKAVELGDEFSMYKLGKCYETGYGVLKINLKAAYNWYKLSADAGQEEAKIALKKFKKSIFGKVRLRK